MRKALANDIIKIEHIIDQLISQFDQRGLPSNIHELKSVSINFDNAKRLLIIIILTTDKKREQRPLFHAVRIMLLNFFNKGIGNLTTNCDFTTFNPQEYNHPIILAINDFLSDIDTRFAHLLRASDRVPLRRLTQFGDTSTQKIQHLESLKQVDKQSAGWKHFKEYILLADVNLLSISYKDIWTREKILQSFLRISEMGLENTFISNEDSYLIIMDFPGRQYRLNLFKRAFSYIKNRTTERELQQWIITLDYLGSAGKLIEFPQSSEQTLYTILKEYILRLSHASNIISEIFDHPIPSQNIQEKGSNSQIKIQCQLSGDQLALMLRACKSSAKSGQDILRS